jgi:hypothetical protein
MDARMVVGADWTPRGLHIRELARAVATHVVGPPEETRPEVFLFRTMPRSRAQRIWWGPGTGGMGWDFIQRVEL